MKGASFSSPGFAGMAPADSAFDKAKAEDDAFLPDDFQCAPPAPRSMCWSALTAASTMRVRSTCRAALTAASTMPRCVSHRP